MREMDSGVGFSYLFSSIQGLYYWNPIGRIASDLDIDDGLCKFMVVSFGILVKFSSRHKL